ncbi:MAG: right-handed parallel beta-helix repeat-containing protein, partial [Phycisphaerae bacterium]|nr:right-handed parallel beta-helix repeat-containing protein [Phycisphaerae bacterium]
MAAFRRLFPLGLLVLVGVVCFACESPGPVVTDPAQLTAEKELQLGEGVVKLSEFRVPPNSRIRGAGFDKTILDAEGKDVALIVDGVQNVDIRDLTIRNAGSAGIRVSHATGITIERVRVTGPVVGINVSDADIVRIANCIVDGGNAGISLKNVFHSTVVNNTIARLGSACVGLSDVTNSVVFNNIFADTSTAVIVSGKRDGLVIDYNLHACFAAGKIEGHVSRPWLATWQTVSGYDKHSVATGVVFADPDNGDFRPVSMLSWQPGVSTVSNWGAANLTGNSAPKKDIAGTPRDGRVDLGAFEVPTNKTAYATDGKFKIQSDAGTKSAGVFTPEGKLVRYLFQDLPLPAGTYDFHLPGQTQLGEAIPAGEYEVRVVEADLGVEYGGFVGNLGASNHPQDSNNIGLICTAWASDGGLLLCNGWTEKAMNLVKIDPVTGKGLWAFKGSSGSFGVASDGKGTAYLVRRTSGWTDPANFQITRINEKDGLPILDEQKNAGAIFEGLTKSVNLDSVAFLGGKLYIADPDANQLLVIDAATMKPLPSISLPNPRSVTAEVKRNRLWVSSSNPLGGVEGWAHSKAIAVDPDGNVVVDAPLADRMVAIAVAGDLLAAADAATGKVFILNIGDDLFDVGYDRGDELVLRLRELGTGDGPYGPWQADRFTFQAGKYGESTNCNLALKPDGTVAVMGPTFGHLSVFDPAGKPVYHAVAHFGNSPIIPHWKHSTGGTVNLIIENSGKMSFWIDPVKNATGMDGYWGVPKSATECVGAFEAVSNVRDTYVPLRFGVFRHQPAGAPRPSGLLICRADGYVYVPVSLYEPAGEGKTGWVVRHEFSVNEAGGLVATDEGTPVAFSGEPVSRWISVTPAGDIISTGSLELGMRWKFTGLDAKDIPTYEVGPDLALKRADAQLTSPYFFDKKAPFGQSETIEMPGDQGTAVCMVLRDTLQSMGFSNSGATDLARFAPDGTLLWLRPMNEVAPVQGIKPLGTHMVTSYGHEAWWMLLTNDGLSMGQFGTPAAWNWEGYWIDHPDHTGAFLGKDGRTHIIAGDYVNTMTH